MSKIYRFLFLWSMSISNFQTEILPAPGPTADLSRISRTNLRLYLINPVGPSVQTLP